MESRYHYLKEHFLLYMSGHLEKEHHSIAATYNERMHLGKY